MKNRYSFPCLPLRAAGIALLILLHVITAQAQTIVKRVLFIGNSFVGVNDLPSIVRQFADHAGVVLEYDSYTPGGATVKYLPHGARSHANNPVVYDLIRSRPWDYIVIQDNQGFYCHTTLGDYGMYAEPEEGHMQLRDSLLKVNPCGKMILFSGWVDKDPYAWEPSLGLHTAEAANQRVYEQYKYMNDHFVHQVIAPIGIAWNRVMAALPKMELFASDNYHPTYEGSYITAATIFSTVYGRNPEEVLFDGYLPPAAAKIVRRLAYEVVADSVLPTGLSVGSPVLTVAGGMVSAPAGYLTYEWYINGMPAPSFATPDVPLIPGDCYQVKVRDRGGCELWSLTQCNTKETTGIDDAAAVSAFQIGPNPVKKMLHLQYKDLQSLLLTDMAGKLVYHTLTPVQEIDMSGYAPGMYLVRVEDSQGRIHTERIIKE